MSARKQVPDLWDQSQIWRELLPWHESVRQHVGDLLSREQLPHALLLTGAPGWGERGLANWIALHLLEQPEDIVARELAHPDLLWIAPDGAVTKIESVRELNEFAVRTSLIAPRKVAVIEAAHTLNRNAANALLKTLEEPPENTYLLLASCHPGRLLATIRSRCQRFNVLSQPDLARTWLAERLDVPDLRDRQFEHGDAPLSVLQGYHDGETSLLKMLGEIAASANPVSYVQRLIEMDPVNLTGRWFRYAQALVAGDLKMRELESVTPKKLIKFVDELLWVRRQLETTNSANPRLLLERLVVQWHSLNSGR
ncbi:MAG: hypothetical protein O7F71_04070 [Gammaproteobacteria bacterium]|nr:hypothetical protein [Gammaproteobacteria bacterium]